MEIDALYLVGFDKVAAIDAVSEEITVRKDVVFGGEDGGNGVFHDLHDGRRMNDHKVDFVRGRRGNDVAARFLTARRAVIKGDSGVKSVLRNSYDRHTFKGFDGAIDAVVAVGNVAGDVAFEELVYGFADEEYLALDGNVVVAHIRKSGVNERGDVVGSGEVFVSGKYARFGSVGGETNGVEFGNDLRSDKLARKRAESHTESFFVIHQWCYRKSFLSLASHSFL